MAGIAAIALGGMVGALSRYGVDRAVEQRSASVFPWSTFVINVSGCLLVGIFLAAIVDRHHTPQWLRLGLIVGFCGAYTTFSTFAQESLDLMEESRAVLAVANVAASATFGVVAVFVGERIGKLL
jgi:fluoride exporter